MNQHAEHAIQAMNEAQTLVARGDFIAAAACLGVATQSLYLADGLQEYIESRNLDRHDGSHESHATTLA